MLPYHFYIEVTGESQGAFASDAGTSDGRSRCHGFRFRGAVKNDPTRSKDATARSHEPLEVIKPWGATSPQFVAAFWNQEQLTVKLTFVYSDGSGNSEAPLQTVELKNATIATYESLGGRENVATIPNSDDVPPQFEKIGFRFEQMTIKNVPGKTAATYDSKKQAA